MKQEEKEFSCLDFEREAIQGLYQKKQYLGEDGVFTPLLKHFLRQLYQQSYRHI